VRAGVASAVSGCPPFLNSSPEPTAPARPEHQRRGGRQRGARFFGSRALVQATVGGTMPVPGQRWPGQIGLANRSALQAPAKASPDQFAQLALTPPRPWRPLNGRARPTRSVRAWCRRGWSGTRFRLGGLARQQPEVKAELTSNGPGDKVPAVGSLPLGRLQTAAPRTIAAMARVPASARPKYVTGQIDKRRWWIRHATG